MKHIGLLFLGLLFLPFLASADIIINEIAWMGSTVEGVDSNKWQYYEWIELYNNGSNEISLTGWILSIEGKKDISLENTIPTNGYYFIERSGYHAFADISADLATSFGAGLANSGAILTLKDARGQEIDRVDGSDNWKIDKEDNIIGNNTTKETAQRTFSGWITATATPKVVNINVLEPEPQQQSQSQLSVSGGGNDTPYIPPEKLPHIKAYAGEDRIVVVGANVEFRGQAFGLNNEPLDNARYLWTFGDGFTKEGQNITHFYRYPGEYIAVLNVSSGEYSASDQFLIRAVPNQVFISEIKAANGPADGGASWIELENKSKEEIDISEMQIKSGNQIFILPKSSHIRPFSFLIIPVSAGGFIIYPGKGSAELLYPGGFKADAFSYDGFPSGTETFNRDGEKIFIAGETPGAKNMVYINPKPAANGSLISINTSKTVFTSENEKNIASVQNPEEISDKITKGETAGQAANVITIGSGNNTQNSVAIYLIAIAGLIFFASAAVFFIRRKSKEKPLF